MNPRLTVYVRSYCHLCGDMLQALHLYRQQWPYELEIIDIDGEPELEKLYGTRVPVLLLNGTELCHYFLDESLFESRLNDIYGDNKIG